jgi:hypothetical protein
MTKKSLDRLARNLGKEEKRGWLTPEGGFFESEETPVITGPDELGGHERAALQWLLANDLELFGELEKIGLQAGFDCWEDSAGTDTIKSFMFRRGFRRVAPE